MLDAAGTARTRAVAIHHAVEIYRAVEHYQAVTLNKPDIAVKL